MACSKSRVDLKRKNNRFWRALCLKVRLIARGLAALQAMIKAFTSVFRLACKWSETLNDDIDSFV